MRSRLDAYAAGMDVEKYLRELPIGSVFTHADPSVLPDSWVKVDTDGYRRTYDWIQFRAADLARTWKHAELTEPIPGSFDEEEAERRREEEMSRDRDGDSEEE